MTTVNGKDFDSYSRTTKWLIAEMAGVLKDDPDNIEITFNQQPIDIDQIASLIDYHLAHSNGDTEKSAVIDEAASLARDLLNLLVQRVFLSHCAASYQSRWQSTVR